MDADLETWPEPSIVEHTPIPGTETGLYSHLDRSSNEIRLVEIHSGHSGAIRCTLTAFPLENAPPYTALSYTWSRPDLNTTVIVNGKKVTAQKNLVRFLTQACSFPEYRSKMFWIDFLCIHQHDECERTHQVGLMSQIYSNAQGVVAWLGPSYGGSEHAMKSLRKIAANPGLEEERLFWHKPPASGLRNLCERRYWFRLWVLQELTLARDVVLLCGCQHLKWDFFKRFLFSARAKTPSCRRESLLVYRATMRSPAVSMIDSIDQAHKESTLLDQMFASRNFDCSDVRDKVYALLGIVTSGHESITPDYTIGIGRLLNNVLENDSKFRQLPSLREVASSCRWLADIVGAPIDQIDSLDGHSDSNPPTASDMSTCPLQDHDSGITLWWANFYKHENAQNLWLKAHDIDNLETEMMQIIKTGNQAALNLLNSVGALNFAEDQLRLAYLLRRSAALVLQKGSYDGFILWLQLCHQHLHQPTKLSLLNAALLEAAEGCREAICQTLLDETDLDVNCVNAEGKNALTIAAQKGWVGGAKLLLRRPDVDVNGISASGWSPLCCAINFDRVAIVQLLLARPDIDVNLSCSGATALDMAVGKDRKNIMTCLLAHPDIDLKISGAGSELLLLAVKKGHTSIATTLLARSDIDIKFAGSRALILAAKKGYTSIVTTLLAHPGIDVNLVYSETTALISAAENNHRKVVARLLAHPDTDIKFAGSRALILAAKKGHTSIVTTLLGYPGVDVNPSYSGTTALILAAKNGHVNVVRRLLNNKRVDSTAMDKHGRTALSWAKEKGFSDIVSTLLTHLLKPMGASQSDGSQAIDAGSPGPMGFYHGQPRKSIKLFQNHTLDIRVNWANLDEAG